MVSDLLALLDTLDGLHKAATEGEWFVATGCSWRRILIVGPDSPVVVPTIERDGHPDLHATMPTLESIVALHNAYPRLSAALREALDVGAHPHIVTCNAARTTPIGGDMCSCPAGLEIKRLRVALTPTTDGEREAREWVARFDLDRPMYAGDFALCPSHLRTALALLATERAKAADAARERAAIVADLRSRLDNLWALMQDHTASPETIAYYQGARETRAFLADRYESGAHTKVTP